MVSVSKGYILILLSVTIALSSSAPTVAKTSKTKSSSPKATSQKLKSHPDPDKFLRRFGYMEELPAGIQHDPETRKQAIKQFQHIAGLPITGIIDNATSTKMLAPRCGNQDIFRKTSSTASRLEQAPKNTPLQYSVPGYKWSKNQLTWKLENFSPDLPSGSQRRALYDAFKQWSDVSALTFQEVASSSQSDLKIKFATGSHGDGEANAFDGPSTVLAHAFFPENGNLHFDEDETWTENTDQGINMMIVATHELGHALGLGHSDEPTAVMAPYYQGYDPNFKLHSDDIAGIRKLYGTKQSPATQTTTKAPATTTTTRRPAATTTTKPPASTTAPKPNTCTTKYDAVIQTGDGRIYVFYDEWIWRLGSNGVDSGFPALSIRFFEQAPSNIATAVYSTRTNFVYIFKGSSIWKYENFRLKGKYDVTNANYPASPIAAIVDQAGKIYLFKGGYYYMFDETRLDVSARSYAMSTKFPGIPAEIEAAVRLNDGYMYFFKGDRYRKFDEKTSQVLPGYPKDKAGPWMGPSCNNGKTEPK